MATLGETIREYQSIAWAAGVVFVAATTYAQMSNDIKAAEKEFNRLQQQFNDYAREQRDRLDRLEQRQERFRDTIDQSLRNIEGAVGARPRPALPPPPP